jgi:hypothetical protein
MKTTHIKNIVIWALIAVNAFFLGFWIVGLAADYGIKIETHRNLQALLLQNGINLDTKSIEETGEMYTMESFRVVAQEQKLANTLLGTTVLTVRGNNYTYTGESGHALFTNGGEFQVLFTPGMEAGGSGTRSTVRRLLGMMDLEARIQGGDDANEANADAETMTAVCVWNGHEVFNCRMRFIFNDGKLTEISGKYAPNIKATSAKNDMTTCATAVLRFLEEIRTGTYKCTEITDVRPGYMLTASFGDGSLDPTWRITTDSGIYYVNAQTGSIQKAA